MRACAALLIATVASGACTRSSRNIGIGVGVGTIALAPVVYFGSAHTDEDTASETSVLTGVGLIILLVSAFTCLDCADEHERIDIAEGSADAQAVLSYVNSPNVTARALVVGAGVDEDTAGWITIYRDGPDRLAGTDDDDRFESLEELTDVAGVDRRTIQLLLRRARQGGYAP